MSKISKKNAKTISLQSRQLITKTSENQKLQFFMNNILWNSDKTAVIICDMWDNHWCKAATNRVEEMAHRMNKVVNELRKKGVLIIHSPSDTMEYYSEYPGRKLAREAPPIKLKPLLKLDKSLPIDDADGGCPCSPKCIERKAWSHQIETIHIEPGDAITDNIEVFNLLAQYKIDNVIMMGVHTNMCVLNRPFGIKMLKSQGLNVLLMRDLTDSMYNPEMSPYVDHFTGTDLVIYHIERYWCPTITSDQILNDNTFSFKEDMRVEYPDPNKYLE